MQAIISVQLHSRVQLFVTPRTAARQASLSTTNSWSLLKLMPKLLYLGWTDNKVLLYSTGNSISVLR